MTTAIPSLPIQAIATLVTSSISQYAKLDHGIYGSLHGILVYLMESLNAYGILNFIDTLSKMDNHSFLVYVFMIGAVILFYMQSGKIMRAISNFNTNKIILYDKYQQNMFMDYVRLNEGRFSKLSRIVLGDPDEIADAKYNPRRYNNHINEGDIFKSQYEEKISFTDKIDGYKVDGYYKRVWVTSKITLPGMAGNGGTSFYEMNAKTDGIEIVINKNMCKNMSVIDYLNALRKRVDDDKLNKIKKWYIKVYAIYQTEEKYFSTQDDYFPMFDPMKVINFDRNIFVDTFFHERKDEIISNLTKVNDNKDYFYSMGQIPRAGYCVYGPPGSGKTNFVYRIARLFDRHIISIDIKNLSKQQVARYFKTFYNRENGAYQVANDAIFFFDEFDETIVELKKRQMYIDRYHDNNRSNGLNQYKIKDDAKIDAIVDAKTDVKVDANDTKVDTKNTDDKTILSGSKGVSLFKEPEYDEISKNMSKYITLNDLLELFSGICPLEGVIIVVATNKFEMIREIAPALFRDGRLTPIHFGYFNGKIIKEVCKKYYNIEPNIDDMFEPNIINSQFMETVLNTHKLSNGYELFLKKYSTLLGLCPNVESEPSKGQNIIEGFNIEEVSVHEKVD